MITMVITYIRRLITPLITTHEPPSKEVSLLLGLILTPRPYLEVHGKL